MTLQEEILEFWFGELNGPHDLGKNQAMWWKKDPALDATIQERFGAHVDQAIAGDYDGWLSDPKGALALVILLDQFTRNIHRGSPKTWEHDDKALKAAQHAVAAGHLDHLRTVECQFLLLPYMHSEDADVHEKGFALIEQILAEVPDTHRSGFDGWHKSAIQHADIIQRFGRYPHRNEILGRSSTEEEEAFLKQPGSSF
jgi:uncharacterized protein (DUF924 family)